MKLKVLITGIALVLSSISFAQTGLMRTKTGVLAIFVRDSLSFTLQLDGVDGHQVRFLHAGYLTFLDVFEFHVAKATDLFPPQKTPTYYLT